jgi:hypothetical protein
VNKYCGELLQIGNENWNIRKNLNWTEIINHHDDSKKEFDGPRTEALRVPELNFHQVTNVKIMSPDRNNTLLLSSMPQANRSEIKIHPKVEKTKQKNKVYSQVFFKPITQFLSNKPGA